MGAAKIENKYSDIDYRMDLIRISLLAMFRALKVQEMSRDSSLLRRSFQEDFLRVESVRGAPRYLEGRAVGENPRMRIMEDWVAVGVWKKKI